MNVKIVYQLTADDYERYLLLLKAMTTPLWTLRLGKRRRVTKSDWITRSLARQFLSQQPNLHGTLWATFTAEEIATNGPVGSGVAWTVFDRYLIDEEVLILLRPTNEGCIFPRRAFDNEGWTQVSRWVYAKLKPGQS